MKTSGFARSANPAQSAPKQWVRISCLVALAFLTLISSVEESKGSNSLKQRQKTKIMIDMCVNTA